MSGLHNNSTRRVIFPPRDLTSAYSSLHLDHLALFSTTCRRAMLRLSSRCAKKRNCSRSFSSRETTGVEGVGSGSDPSGRSPSAEEESSGLTYLLAVPLCAMGSTLFRVPMDSSYRMHQRRAVSSGIPSLFKILK